MFRLAGLLAVLLCALAAPAAGQDSAPQRYHQLTDRRVDPDSIPPALRARQEAAANAAEQGCESGVPRACAALGEAYMNGAGRAQNRPAAEVLLRQACHGGVGDACGALGLLLADLVASTEPEQRSVDAAYVDAVLRRGCSLGGFAACEMLAEGLELPKGKAGQGGVVVLADGGPVGIPTPEAEALRRETCARGGAASCRVLASRTLAGAPAPGEAAKAMAMLERLCREGDGQSCKLLVDGAAERPPATPLAALHERGCAGGIGKYCRDLALAAFAAGSGPPEKRSAALALFDRACDLDQYLCADSEAIRARPGHAARCAEASRADCVALGVLYSDSASVLHSPAEALGLLGSACEAGAGEACGAAAQLLLDQPDLDRANGAARAEEWLRIGCESGRNFECEALAQRLLADGRTPEEQARGGELLALVCERGDMRLCDELAKRSENDPAAILPVADQRFAPPDPEAVAERYRELNEARKAEQEAWHESLCTTSAVMLRGVRYEDRLCSPLSRVIRGFVLEAGQAPWQALLWRPERMDDRRLDSAQRIACGGALVREGWVLTAAHCVVDAKGRLLTGPGHRIRLGVHSAKADEGYYHPISAVFAHPDYHEPSRAFDIALIRFDPQVGRRGAKSNPVARIRLDPLPLEQREIRAGMPVYVYGWGQTAFRGRTSDLLKGARLQLEEPVVCGRRTRFNISILKDALLCASAPDMSQACDGDSGGPLVTYGDADRVPTVIGVVSAGTECGRSRVPSRYTRVAKVRDWLNAVIAGRSQEGRR